MPFRLDRHCALVTGSTRNLGRAIALALGAMGSNVVCAYQHGAEDAKEVAADARASGVDAMTLELDLADTESLRSAVAKAHAAGFAIDILVNNAAIRPRTKIADVTEAEWDLVLATNLRGPFFLAQSCIPAMAAQSWGRIINVSGVDAYRGNPQRPHIVASKTGIIGLTRALANETARSGITVNAVVPGTMNTPRYHAEWEGDPAIDTALRQERLWHIPVTRLGEPKEIGTACVFLAAEESAYITGQELLVTGGMHPAVRQPSLEYEM